jgi:soluble lytic murein transglycosylase
VARGNDPVLLAQLAEAEFGIGNVERAGELFRQAAESVDSVERGVFLVRAATALEEAGRHDEAAPLYHRAAVQLPQISGWLAVREAGITDETVRALSLLRRSPPEASVLASRVRGAVLLQAGDSVRALAAFAAAEDWSRAAAIAHALQDTATVRQYALRALESDDTAAVRTGLTSLEAADQQLVGTDLYQLASAHRRLGDLDRAIAVLEASVVAGDSSSATLRRLGDLLSSQGRLGDAADAFQLATVRGGRDGVLSEHRWARVLVRMGRTADGYGELAAFAGRHPEEAMAAEAVDEIADWHRRAGRRAAADSVLGVIVVRWPNSSVGGRARMALAVSALSRRDTVGAIAWYRAEADAGTADRHAARYILGSLLQRSGDTTSAREHWLRLARLDPVGYYGTIARQAAGLPDPLFGAVEDRAAGQGVASTLERLDLLRLSCLDEEAEVLVRRSMERTDLDAAQTLALAEGLIERGWMREGTNLGWRVAGERSLNDPWVLRVVFPWPLRSLIEQEAAEFGLDPYLLAAVIRQESNFRPAVVSRAGAHGLMQLMPTTAAGLARQEGMAWDRRYLTSAEVNLHLGAAHLAALLRTYGGDPIPALAAYNAGGRPVARWLRNPGARDRVQFVEQIGYPETRGFVQAVVRNWALYRVLYPQGPDTRSHQ